MNRRYFYYLQILAIFISLQSLIIVGFNLLVDPYGIFQLITLENFNQEKPSKIKNPRLFKAIDIINLKPKTILLGSSRTDLGLDPNYPLLKAYPPIYNLGILGVNSEELRYYFEHALVNQDNIQRVIIGLDFFMFNTNRDNKPGFKQNRLLKKHLIISDFVDFTLSTNALNESFQTISFNQSPDRLSPYFLNGMSDTAYFLKYVFKNTSITKEFDRSLTRFLSDPTLYGNYTLSPERLEDMQKIIRVCQEKKIECITFISPAHALQWEAIQVAGLWPEFEEWKQDLVRITPVWDFSGYNNITTEQIDNKMKNYLDSSHYTKKVGDLVLQRILQGNETNTSNDFGVLISPTNIESHLVNLRKEQETWTAKNPDLVEYVQQIKRKVEAKRLREEME
ncbi:MULTISPECIES: hypothetical protein [Spirulina sp. CCY15215]|uniref:hypothetical protein n=1 Tax=Spirulina sp. CCY15215 TaxID=2767591 RepID=UPI0019503780|nr:hypothetical protein [Spirulina major]